MPFSVTIQRDVADDGGGVTPSATDGFGAVLPAREGALGVVGALDLVGGGGGAPEGVGGEGVTRGRGFHGRAVQLVAGPGQTADASSRPGSGRRTGRTGTVRVCPSVTVSQRAGWPV